MPLSAPVSEVIVAGQKLAVLDPQAAGHRGLERFLEMR